MRKINTLLLLFICCFTAKIFAQPANDLCAGASTLPQNGTCINGTTVAAGDDWVSTVGCQSGNNHPEVWYTFTATGTLASFVVTSGTMTGDVELVLASATGACSGLADAGSQCGPSALNASFSVTNGTLYYVTVSSATGSQGTFSICLTTSTPPAACTDNDACNSPAAITFTTGVQTCISDCNTGAAQGPNFSGNNCYDFTNETVWYEVTTTTSSATIDISLTSTDFSTPYFTLFTSSNCTQFTIINCTQGSGGSASNTINVSANTTYLIAVSDVNGVSGNFNLCITVNDDNSACNKNNALSVTATSMGSPLAGPYLPGEIVSFCYTITNFTQANCNYLQGIVPTFGDCWDPASFNAQGQPVTITTPLATAGTIQNCPPGPPCAWAACEGTPAGTWSWFPAGAATYNNINNPDIPNGTAMPAGWYFLSSYNPSNGSCTGDPTDPDNSYGDSNFPNCTDSTLDWTVCFQLIAGPSTNCVSGETDCSVTFKTYADGEIGVWDNVGCTFDIPSASPSTILYCCAPTPTAFAVAGGGNYCAGGTGVPVTLGNSEIGVNYELYLNGNPTGNIINGTGAALNFGNQTAAGTYTIAGTITATSCPGAMSGSVIVTINALPTASVLPSPASVCTSVGLVLNGNPSGGSGTYSTHSWTGAGSSSLSSTTVVNPTFNSAVAGNVAVTYSVTDNLGCTGTTNATITVTGPSFSILPASPTICIGDTVDLSATITLSPVNYQSTFTESNNVVIPNSNPSGVNDTNVVSGINPATLSAGSIASVCFTINHPKHSDIGNNGNANAITLTSPGGTVYNSGITIPLPNGSGTATFCFPSSVLNTITGNANGNWILNIKDSKNPNEGNLVSWTIIFNNTNSSTYSWSPTTSMINSGTLSPSVFPASTATYTLSATDGLGCTASQGVTVTVNSLPVAPTAAGDTICSGSTAILTATAPGGTYQWYDASTGGTLLFSGATFTSPALSSATNYYVQATVGGCPGPRTAVPVFINPALTVSNTVVTCSGDNTTYTVSFDINGGDPASYAVSGGTGTLSGNTFTSNPVTSGNSYSFTATDAFNCTPQVVSGSQNCSCSAAASVSGGGTTCSGTPASNIVFTLAGTAPWNLTYSINGTPQTPVTGIATSPYTISNPSAGTYTISSISDGSCTGSGSGSASVVIQPLPTAAISGGGSICNDGSTDTISITLSGTGPWGITYAINGSPQAPVTGIISSPYNFNTSTAGTYTLTAVSDANCAGTLSGSATVTVNSLPTPTITPGSATTFCSGSSVNLASSAATSYLWSNSATTSSITISASGTYNVTVTDANGCSGAATAVSVTVYSNPVPTLSAGGPTSFCSGDSVQLSSSVSNAYLWNTAETSQSIYADTNGVYTVTLTDGNNCSGDTSITVTVYANPASSTTSTDENCGQGNGTATVSGSGGATPYTYLWAASAGNQTTATAISLVAGSYNVTITDANGCTDVSTATVNSPAGLTASSGFTTASCGNCNGIAVVTPSGGISPYTYLWSDSQSDSTATALCGGNISVTVTDNSGGGGCTYSTTIAVDSTEAVTATSDSLDATCGLNNGEAYAYPSGGTSPYAYLWSNGQTDQTATGLSTGSYTVTITDINGCTVSATTSVNSITPPTVSTTSVNITCNGFADGQATANISAGSTPYTYAWSGGQITATATGLSAGTVYVTITDANNCTAVDSATITEPNSLVLSTGSIDVLCNGDSNGQATVSVGGGTSAYTYVWSDGQTTNTATGLSAGILYLTVTDNNGCTASDSALVGEPASVSGIISSSNTLCVGDSSGSATVTSSGGTSPYTYLWSDAAAQTGGSATGLPSGSYTVTITDNNGCSGTASASVGQPTPIVVSTSSTDANCGASDGTATASPAGGSGPYSYLWSNSQIATTATGLPAGNYIVTITDNNGCTQTAIATVANVGGLTAIISSVNATCNGISDGSATATPSGGATPITYLWDASAGNQSTQTATGLAAGSHSVTITDNLGCSFNAIATVGEPALLSLTFVTTAVSCSGDSNGTASITASGGTSPYGYLWTDGQTTASATGLQGGLVSVTVTDNNNCSSVQASSVGQPVPLSITPSSTDETCGQTDGTASVTVAGGTTPYSYSWSNAQTGSTATGLIPGNYFITITDNNSCTGISSVTVNGTGAVSVSLNSNSVTCNGASDGDADATASGGATPYSYLWSDGQTTAVATALPGGNYAVTVTDNAGCTATSSILVGEPNAIAITTASTDVNCFGDTSGAASAVVTGGVSPYSYLWSNGQTAASIGGLNGGVYSVTVTDTNGCTNTQSVTVNPPLPLSSNPSAVDATCGNNNGSITINASGGTAPYSYTWSNGQTGAVATGLAPGSYSVTITDNNGCDTTGSSTVNAVGGSSVSLSGNDVSCNGAGDGAATATISGGTSPYSLLWSDGQTTTTITGLAGGTYSVTVTDSNTCTDTTSVTISEPSAIVLTITNTSDDCGKNTGSATTNATGGTGTYSYQWSNGQVTATATGLAAGTYSVTITDNSGCTVSSGTSVADTGSVIAGIAASATSICAGSGTTLTASGGTGYLWSTTETSASINPTPSATATFYVTVTDGSCSGINSVLITVNSLPSDSISGFTSICSGNTTTLTAVETGASYLWSTSETTSSILVSTAGIYSLTVTNSCGSVSDSVTVSINPSPNAFAGNDTTIFQETEITLTATGGNTYLWNTNPPQVTASITVIPELTSVYYVTVTNTQGCTAIDSVIVTVENKYVIYVASMFSPNNDGYNDAVFVRGKGIETINFVIYDRWGEKVFESSDITIGWDGKYKGKDLNSAVFVYVLKATMDDGNTVERKGNITLVR